MIVVLSLEEFASKRRKAQEDLENEIRPEVRRAVDLGVNTSGWRDLLREVRKRYEEVYRAEGGEGKPSANPRLFVRLENTLKKTKVRDESTVDRITVWLATAILSYATIEATNDDPEELVLEWVTMGDDHVRPEHVEASGQQRPIGEKFDVGGVEMEAPGDPSAPIELWINCRCTLRPALASETLVAAWHKNLVEEYGNTRIAATKESDMADEVTEVEKTEETPAPEVTAVPWFGVLAPEGIASGDGRMFSEGSLRFRPLPLPLTYQKSSGNGHDGSVTVARIDKIERVGQEMRATGVMLATPEADEVVGLLADFGRFGVSVDADDVEMAEGEGEVVEFTDARICSASIVAIPAFAEAYVSLGEPPEDFFPEDGEEVEIDGHGVPPEESLAASAAVDVYKDLAPGKTEDGPGWLTHPVDTDRLRDYWVRGPGAAKINWGTPGDFDRCRVNVAEYVKPQYLNGYCANRHYDALGFWPGRPVSGDTVGFLEGEGFEPSDALSVVASGGFCAPSEWFEDPKFTEKCHLTVTEEGRVFGHIAAWKECHSAYLDQCVVAPHSQTNYAYFATGQVLTDKGMVATGPITIDGPHAKGRARLRPAMAHYENTTAAVADVAVGEDEHGIWCAGWIRPGTPEEKVVALRASDVSGDWREAPNGNLELIAALAVNSGGFYTPRLAAAISEGRQISLVAAGMLQSGPRAVVTTDPPKDEISRLSDLIVSRLADEMEARNQRKARMAELAKKVGI